MPRWGRMKKGQVSIPVRSVGIQCIRERLADSKCQYRFQAIKYGLCPVEAMWPGIGVVSADCIHFKELIGRLRERLGGKFHRTYTISAGKPVIISY